LADPVPIVERLISDVSGLYLGFAEGLSSADDGTVECA
jgi:hypothetical protein